MIVLLLEFSKFLCLYIAFQTSFSSATLFNPLPFLNSRKTFYVIYIRTYVKSQTVFVKPCPVLPFPELNTRGAFIIPVIKTIYTFEIVQCCSKQRLCIYKDKTACQGNP